MNRIYSCLLYTSVSLQWDMIEQELRNPSFWGFLSNTDGKQNPTRIDLIHVSYTHLDVYKRQEAGRYKSRTCQIC